MSTSDWDRKRTLEKMFQYTPPHLRTEFIERMKREQDNADSKSKKEPADKNKPSFLKKKAEPETGTAKKAGQSSKSDKSPKKAVTEIMTGAMGAVSPRPMLVTQVPGTELAGDLGYSATTSPDTGNGHTHTAYYDEAGNGYTSEEGGHSHTVRSFMVAPYQSPDGSYVSEHSELLSKPARTPGAEYQDYTGEL